MHARRLKEESAAEHALEETLEEVMEAVIRSAAAGAEFLELQEVRKGLSILVAAADEVFSAFRDVVLNSPCR